MKITLFDHNEDLCAEWRRAFNDCEEVTVQCCEASELEHGYSAIATAGNSFGVMTGGIDLAVRDLFGYGLQDAVQDAILANAEVLPVGQALFIGVEDGPHDAVIYAPTMFTPRTIPSLDVVYSMMVTIFMATKEKCKTVAIPGLGTGVGGVPAEEAAKAMRIGYDAARRLMEGDKA